jgi:hypothetical protein
MPLPCLFGNAIDEVGGLFNSFLPPCCSLACSGMPSTKSVDCSILFYRHAAPSPVLECPRRSRWIVQFLSTAMLLPRLLGNALDEVGGLFNSFLLPCRSLACAGMPSTKSVDCSILFYRHAAPSLARECHRRSRWIVQFLSTAMLLPRLFWNAIDEVGGLFNSFLLPCRSLACSGNFLCRFLNKQRDALLLESN